MTIRILQGDCRDVLKTLPDASVDSIVTDPPYHLTNKGGGPHNKTPNAYSRAQAGAGSGGFMGMAWDGGDIAQNPAVWAECLRVLKPGGYLLAFSGTRTQHRMVCAIEDAGFEVRDQIGWAFGSGFPKSHNGEWGGTALKPAWEPICMARKPLIGTVEANWREHGTGALNIDGCRVEHQSEADKAAAFPGGKVTSHGSGSLAGPGDAQEVKRTEFSTERADGGRWPANLIHDGSDEVLAAFPDAPGALSPVTGDEPSSSTLSVYGKFKRAASDRTGEASANSDNDGLVGFKMKPGARREATSAARFFYCAKADRKDRNAGLEGMPTRDLNWSSGDKNPGAFQSANTNRAVQNHHPTVKPTDLMRYLCRLVTPAGGTVLDPFMGSGSTLKAAELEGFSAIGIELDHAYIEIARRRIAADAPLFAEVTS